MKSTKQRSDNQRRSRDQERRAAKRYGGRRQPGSGATPHAKGDVRAAGERRECKFTRAASFALKLDELRKIEIETPAGELPTFEIEFQSGHPHRRYVVVPEWAYLQLKGE